MATNWTGGNLNGQSDSMMELIKDLQKRMELLEKILNDPQLIVRHRLRNEEEIPE